jgi:hypothetical protein
MWPGSGGSSQGPARDDRGRASGRGLHCGRRSQRHVAGPRRLLNEAGERVCAVDRSFQSFEAHGGRGHDSFLRIVRKPPLTSPLARPFDGAPQELRLLVA